MAVVAAFSFPWSTPLVAPQGQGVPTPQASVRMVTFQMLNIIPAPYVYNLVPPATPTEAELISLNEIDVQILST